MSISSSTNENKENEISIASICSFPAGHSFRSVSADIKGQTIRSSVNAVLAFASTTILLMAVGRNYPTETFASIGVGLSTYNIACIAILTGWSSALDTLCSISYGKDKQGKEVGIWTQIGMGVSFVMSILVSILFVFFSHPVVSAVFGETYANNGASEFLQHVCLSAFLFGFQSCLSKSLQAQHLAEYPMRATGVSTGVTLLCVVFIIPNWRDAPKAVAYSMALVNFSLLMSMILLSPADALFRKVSWNIFRLPSSRRTATSTAVVEDREELVTDENQNCTTTDDDDNAVEKVTVEETKHTDQVIETADEFSFWTHFTKDRINEYLAIGIDSFGAIFLEWFPFEANFFFVAALSETDVATYNIYINVATLVYSVSNGVSVAASSFVGKLLGEGHGILALVYGRMCVVWAVIAAVILGSSVILFNEPIISLYTSDSRISERMKSLLFIFLCHHVCDNCQYVLQAIYRGAGRQGLLPRLLLLTLWVFGIGCAFVFSKVFGWGLRGVTGGFVCGFLIEIPVLIWEISRWDWVEIAREITKNDVKKNDDTTDMIVNNDEESTDIEE